MDVREYVLGKALKAKKASCELARRTAEEKNADLEAMASAIERHAGDIRAANAQDVEKAKAAGISPAMIDRLTLTDARFAAMVAGVRHVASLPDPVGETLWTRTRPSGITIRKVRVPFGVIAVIFESRPNVFVDTAALCLKTGNAIILRGGREALGTNAAIAAAVCDSLKSDAVQFIDITDHAAVTELVRAVGLVDVAIPRGGERLIRAVCEAALVPVLKHYKGVCHVYVDGKADLDMALRIIDNAKTQRPGVCNAAECLLVQKDVAPAFMPKVEEWAREKGVALHVCDETTPDETWEREYLSLDLNVGVVDGVREAIEHINRYGSHHSDVIVTGDDAAAEAFLRDVDSAAVYHNASSRFTDGSEFGMGAEIGISTDKLHARGPMGLEELTTYKYRITGNGAIRS